MTPVRFAAARIAAARTPGAFRPCSAPATTIARQGSPGVMAPALREPPECRVRAAQALAWQQAATAGAEAAAGSGA